METEVDELFLLTSKDGKTAIETTEVKNDVKDVSPDMIYE